MPIYCINGVIFALHPSHRPPLCQANHDKPSMASGSATSGLVASGLVTSGSATSGLAAYGWVSSRPVTSQFGYAG